MEHLEKAILKLHAALESLYEHGEEQGDSLELSRCRNRVNRALHDTASYATKTTENNHADTNGTGNVSGPQARKAGAQ